MPTARLPLVGSFNQRGLDGTVALDVPEDQSFKNCVFDVITNQITGKSTVYVSKRPGWGISSLVSAGAASTGLIKPQSFSAQLSAFGETNSTVYHGTISVGVITGRALHFTETLISAVGCVAIKSSDGTGWYYMAGAKDVTAYTMDGNNSTTVTDIKIAGATSTAGLYPGQKLTAASNITAGTRVVSVNAGAFTAVLDTATTGGAFNDLAVTKEPIAKIIDADFVTTGTYIGAFAPMDGWLFYPTDDGYVNNSDLNSVSAYTANARIAVQQAPDPTVAIAIQKNIVVAFGTGSNEKFQNAGFSTAPLQVAKSQVEHIGTLDQRSVTTIEDDIYYVATPSDGDLGVYRMRALNSTRVSTPVVDRIVGTGAQGGAIYAGAFRLGGYPYAQFVSSLAQDGPASNILLESGDIMLLETTPGGNVLMEDNAGQTASYVRTMVYNAALNIWSEWDCSESTFIDSVGSGTNNQIIATSRFDTGGYVYTINPVADGELYQDAGVAYSMVIRTSRLDFGTGKRKYISRIRLICDRQDSGTVTLECNDNDYDPSSWVTIGTFDITSMEPQIAMCGSHTGGRAYRLTHSDNAPFRGESIEIEYEIGAQ